MTVGLVVQVVVTGLAAGATYALAGIGFTLVARLTGVLLLAHGDVAGAATLVAVALVTGTGAVARSSIGVVPQLAAILAVLVAAGLFGAGGYRLVLRPVLGATNGSGPTGFGPTGFGASGAGAVAWVGVVVALAVAIEGALAAGFPRNGYPFPDPARLDRFAPIGLGAGAALQWTTIESLVLALVLGIGAERLLTVSRAGRALEAIASDREAALVVGLPVERLVTVAFALAAVLAAAAGLLSASAAPVTAKTGVLLGLKGIAAALLAGLGGPRAVLFAALALGVVEEAVVTLHVPGFPALHLGPGWRDLGPLMIGVAALAWRARLTGGASPVPE